MRTMARYSMGKWAALSLTLAVLLAAGCSKSAKTPSQSAAASPETAVQPAAAPEPVSAKKAFALMYRAAHEWSPGAKLIRLSAKEVPGFTNADGKAAMWEAIIASPSTGKYRVYSYSIASAPPEIFRGLDAGAELAWHGITHDAMPVELSLFKVDSEAAYQTAAADAARWLKKNPDKMLTSLELGATYRFHAPVWYVQWGTAKAGYAVWVDASTGKVLKAK